MLFTISAIAGGIGLFLLGMILMTEGLKSAAGQTFERALRRFTQTPGTAIASGAGITALVQSSSATTVTTIGFVSAGLMTFPQALGVIFGANLGSTSTGWIVGLLGLQLSIGVIAQPMVAIGALMRLLGRGRMADAGLELAGFGLIFVGIDILQAGTAELATRITPEDFPEDTWGGRLVLVGIGTVMTVLMQSSSAAVATTLTALYSGAIGLEQAAALVIGQNLGTTVKAAIVSIGASVPAKRTALAHILFNALTALIAFALLPLFVHLVDAAPSFAPGDAALVIALFHTAFNLLGIVLFLPFLHPFAQAIERLIPEHGPELTRYLDDSVTETPAIAAEAARRTVKAIATVIFEEASAIIDHSVHHAKLEQQLFGARQALRDTRRFLSQTPGLSSSEEAYVQHVSALHALEHLERLVAALEQSRPFRSVGSAEQLERLRSLGSMIVHELHDALAEADDEDLAALEALLSRVAEKATDVAAERRSLRPATLDALAAGHLPPDRGLQILEAARWLDRVAYHAWRIAHHLIQADAESDPRTDEEAHEHRLNRAREHHSPNHS